MMLTKPFALSDADCRRCILSMQVSRFRCGLFFVELALQLTRGVWEPVKGQIQCSWTALKRALRAC